ncbi:MAG: hypothetical protein K0S00_4091 [Xanthobacteraceae bacterium]|jgi:hypothetical protein|nr:hypothetical protein [Xanthobacteraceae bacterium]
MSSETAYLQRKRAELAMNYARLRKHHGRRAGVAQQLKRATIRLLRAELAAARAVERARNRPRTLAGDLDLFINR